MASFKVSITPNNNISIRVLGEESNVDGTRAQILKSEIVLKLKAAELLRDRLTSALEAIKSAETEEKEDEEMDDISDSDLDDDA